LEYLRAEPYLTVYGEAEETTEIKENITKLETRIRDQDKKIEEQAKVIDDLSNFMTKRVEEITQNLVNEWLEKSDTGKKLLETWKRMMEQEKQEEREMQKEGELKRAEAEMTKRMTRQIPSNKTN
jgi:hypothetical protein